MRSYPVALAVHSPPRFQRVQLALRLAVGLALGFLGISLGWIGCALYLLLPVFAATMIASRGEAAYLTAIEPRLTRVLRWFVAFHAYLALAIDRFPVEDAGADVRLVVQPHGHPTVGSALLRLVTSLPTALVLGFLAMLGSLLWIIGAIAVLVSESQPQGIIGYQRAIVRWQARWLAYHASLVDAYPPFELETGEESELPGPPMVSGPPGQPSVS